MIFGFHRWFLYISGHTCRGNFKKYHLINYMTQFTLSIWTCQDTKLIYIFASHSFKSNIYVWWSCLVSYVLINSSMWLMTHPRWWWMALYKDILIYKYKYTTTATAGFCISYLMSQVWHHVTFIPNCIAKLP